MKAVPTLTQSIQQMMKPNHNKVPLRSTLAYELVQEAIKSFQPSQIPPLKIRNGAGHFVLPLQRLLFTYCSHCEDSAGTREFIKKHVVELANANPTVEFAVEPKWDRRPSIYAHYLESRQKVVCLANKSVLEIMEIVQGLRDESGCKAKPFHLGVTSDSSAVRPIWSPFTSPKVE